MKLCASCRGRRFKLDYRQDPIILASARLDIVLDWIRLPGAANLAFGYSTDRVWKSGGSVTSSSFTEQLGVTGIASDIALLAVFTFLLRWVGPANYGIFVTAISAFVVLLVALTGVDPQPVIAARALNTAIGGALALAASGVDGKAEAAGDARA